MIKEHYCDCVSLGIMPNLVQGISSVDSKLTTAVISSLNYLYQIDQKVHLSAAETFTIKWH